MNGDVDREFTGDHDVSNAHDNNKSLDVLELEPLNGKLWFLNSFLIFLILCYIRTYFQYISRMYKMY